MANYRIPLIVNSNANQIQELPSNDNLLLNTGNLLKLGGSGTNGLEISHASNGRSIIKHTPGGSGDDLRLQIAANQLVVEKETGKNFIVADYTSNELRLFYANDGTNDANNLKLTTISTGCTISGNINVRDAIIPSYGDSATKGIQWPTNPGGGSGDAASITYFVSDAGTEKTTLKISNQNDGNESTNVDNIEISTANDSHTIVSATGDASSTTTGAFRVAGGVGIVKNLYVGGGIFGGSNGLQVEVQSNNSSTTRHNLIFTASTLNTTNNGVAACRLRADQSDGIQYRPSTEELRVDGDIIAFHSSDERMKKNIKKIDDPLAKVISIGGYTFDWIEESDKGESGTGVIAQEIEKLGLPGLVKTRKKTGYKAVDYEKLIPLLIEAIKELDEKVKSLEA